VAATTLADRLATLAEKTTAIRIGSAKPPNDAKKENDNPAGFKGTG